MVWTWVRRDTVGTTGLVLTLKLATRTRPGDPLGFLVLLYLLYTVLTDGPEKGGREKGEGGGREREMAVNKNINKEGRED